MDNLFSTFDLNGVLHTVRSTAISFINMQRQNAGTPIDYVEFVLPSSMNQLPEFRNIIQQRFLGKPTMSLLELEAAFERIANDPRPQGVILYFRGFAMSLADLQTLRGYIEGLRMKGKRVIAFAMMYSTVDYYVASACDEILLQPGGGLMTTGILQQQVFLKDGLDAVGIKADSVAISPYKTFADRFTRTSPSDEGQKMTNWLLDSTFDMLLDGIAEGRNIEVDAVRDMIDQSPLVDQAALEGGYVDALINEEGLQKYLKAKHIVLWQQADGMIPLKVPHPSKEYVAVLRAAGAMMPGESANPPVDLPIPIVGGERMGDMTIVRQARNLMIDDNCKAVVLYVDSPGGVAVAAEAMTSALNELAKTKPLVVYMGGVAASGGYYIATAADYIVAQPGTITGSIGVIMMKLITSEALEKIHFNPHLYERGKHAGIYSSTQAFSDEERNIVMRGIENQYQQFVERVATARKMKPDTVDKVAGGRVWTGKQALEHGLVDELGGLNEALNKARQLANIAPDSPIGIIQGSGKPLPAQVAEQLDPAATIRYWHDNLLHMTSGYNLMLMPFEWRQ
ncbi:MAG: signal peptide peptidase SppA [Anaerolineae bacterium]|nr:signal peptide peptidase SppA [Anaerolineae bacterium]